MGVPGFYSWLTKRYPMIKHMINKESLPEIDYLYLDMNGIIYKCVKDDSIIFKAQLKPKELQEIWIDIFNYINMIVDMLKPNKMILMALDGVAPRSKMNNQRSRRFRSAKDYKQFLNNFYGYSGNADSQENFKNNSISPGTKFMKELNEMLNFFIQKKISEDDYWKSLSIVFTGSDCPGEGEHKIMQFVRANASQFDEDDSHCFYGADADLIMLTLTLPIKHVCIIREEYIHASQNVHIMASRKEKQINFQLIYISILKECFDIQYKEIKSKMTIQYKIENIIKDFVFLFFFIGNDFLPRIYAYNIRESSIEKLLEGFKNFLIGAEQYITGGSEFNLKEVGRLLQEVIKFEYDFINDKENEAAKILKQSYDFEDELQRRFREKLLRQEQTLLQLKQSFLNQDVGPKINYYQTHFNINPAENPALLHQLCGYYVYGLKFVYEYYFVNLPSWSWYYPFYFAPLLTDVQWFINVLLASENKLDKLQLSKPFDPFKQLLCILPKESSELLPSTFQKYLQEQTSILRKEVDYYPDQFQIHPYGAFRAHEGIVLIPFLNQELIDQVYQEEIKNITKEEHERNILRKSRLYQYSLKEKQFKRQVQSPFEHVKSFQCSISIEEVDLLSKFNWSTIKKHIPISKGDEKLLKMPTLYMRKFQSKAHQIKSSTFYDITIEEEELNDVKLGECLFYGYPNEHSGRVQAILNGAEFKTSPQFNPNSYRRYIKDNRDFYQVESIKKKKRDFFELLLDQIKHRYRFLHTNSIKTLVFIKDTQYFTRTIGGEFERVYSDNAKESYVVVPLAIASRERLYKQTLTTFKFSSLEEQFKKDQEVLLCCPNAAIVGNKARVVGYNHKQGLVRVRVFKKRDFIKEKVNILKIASTNDVFFALKFVSAIIGLRSDILQTVIGSINVGTPKDSKLPPSIDIGLNFINRRDNQVVPNLIRVNFQDQKYQKEMQTSPFKFLEFSTRALEILIEYKQKFPQVIDFIKNRHEKLVRNKDEHGRIEWNASIQATDMYENEASKSLMKVYLWLIQKEETHMPIGSIYSKQILQKKIKILQEQFLLNNHRRFIKEAEHEFETDPNFLFSLKLSKLGALYLSAKPKNHSIGDQVICLTPQFFGHYGVVIGIDDRTYQVLFEQPSFGKNDLGGLCQNLWGSSFEFRQILNIELWHTLFKERQNVTQLSMRMGWTESTDYYYPKYRTKPLKNFQDVKVFTGKQQNKAYFPAGMLQYIFTAQQNLKQIHISEDYIINDNKHSDHQYRYDKKKSYIEKEEVDQAAKNIKYIQKITQPQHQNQKQEDFDQEIIENKIAQIQINDPKKEEIGEEEDAADILG